MSKPNNISQWISTTQCVDISTGELITQAKAKRDYYILKKTITYEVNEHTRKGIKRHTWHCKKSNQLDLFGETE